MYILGLGFLCSSGEHSPRKIQSRHNIAPFRQFNGVPTGATTDIENRAARRKVPPQFDRSYEHGSVNAKDDKELRDQRE